MGCRTVAELRQLVERRWTIVMPTICHKFDERVISRAMIGRHDGWWSSQRTEGRDHPAGILMLKSLPVIVICVRGQLWAKQDVRETWRGAACQHYCESGNAHDRRAPRNHSAAAFPDRPDKRHVCTPQSLSIVLLLFLDSRLRVLLGAFRPSRPFARFCRDHTRLDFLRSRRCGDRDLFRTQLHLDRR